MSIFSSWLAAPNSGVITYSGTSTKGTMAASPCPMPEVSTTIRSKPATLQAAITSGSAWLISLPKSRVASERMKTRAPTLPTACGSLPPKGAFAPWDGPAALKVSPFHGPDGVHADAVTQQARHRSCGGRGRC